METTFRVGDVVSHVEDSSFFAEVLRVEVNAWGERLLLVREIGVPGTFRVPARLMVKARLR